MPAVMTPDHNQIIRMTSSNVARVKLPETFGMGSKSNVGPSQFKASSFPSLNVPYRNIGADGTVTLPPARTSQVTSSLTTLDNGLRVASIENYLPTAAVGAFVRTGSRFESPDERGMSYLLERLAFKSTEKRTQEEMTDAIENLGGNAYATCDRDVIWYTAEVIRPHLETMMDILGDTLTNPRFDEEELAELKDILAYELEDIEKNYQYLVTEQCLATAFSTTSLGSSVLPTVAQLSSITRDELIAWKNRYYVAPRVVISGVGVDHGTLVGLSQKYFGALPPETNPPIPTPMSKYIGGVSYLVEDPNANPVILGTDSQPETPKSHVCIGMPIGGFGGEDFLVESTLRQLLGGGSSFSSGGPGKGVYSRFYRKLMGSHHWINHVEASLCQFEDRGLFLIYGNVKRESHSKGKLERLTDRVREELHSLAHDGPFPSELDRAKNQLKSSIMMSLEMRAMAMEDLGRQVMLFGKRHDDAEIVRRIDAITSDDVVRVVTGMLSQPATLVVRDLESNIRQYNLESMHKSIPLNSSTPSPPLFRLRL